MPAAVTTAAAMLWAGWAGRERPGRDFTEADQARLGAALSKPMPQRRPAPRAPRERSTGVAVRSSSHRPAGPSSTQQTRRSA